MESNLDIYNKSADEYTNYELVAPERNILIKLKEKWHKSKMLDIGVGTGRTSYTFSAIVNDYTGIDYSHAMIERCKATIPQDKAVRFCVEDATDLGKYVDSKFDFILLA